MNVKDGSANEREGRRSRRQHAFERFVVFLDGAHGVVDPCANLGPLGVGRKNRPARRRWHPGGSGPALEDGAPASNGLPDPQQIAA